MGIAIGCSDEAGQQVIPHHCNAYDCLMSMNSLSVDIGTLAPLQTMNTDRALWGMLRATWNQYPQICIMRREKREEGYQSYPTQLSMSTMIEDLKARKGVDASEEGIREQYSHTFNPMINEGFFADKVVIVEGPSEQYALPIYADALGYNLNRNNISVVHSDGKGQMDRLLRVFNGFEIPTYLWFDGDKKSEDKAVRDKTLELLEFLGDPVEKIEDVITKVSEEYAILEYNLEELLMDELPEYANIVQESAKVLGPTGKPLKHRFVANWLKRRVDDGESIEKILPKTIIEIVKKIEELSLTSKKH